MPHSLSAWHDRLKAVEREYRVAAEAIEQLRSATGRDAAHPPAGTSPRDLMAVAASLESTFLIRLWAEFETALLSYYRSLQGDPEVRIRATDLVNTVAAVRRGRAIPDDVRLAVHEVRDYRNSLVHERGDPTPPVRLAEARRRLNLFLGKLPQHWQ